MSIRRKEGATLRLVQLALLTAIIVILQLTGTAIKLNILGTSVSLVLVPIVLGAMLLGPASGAFLGFVFGLITYLMGVFGADTFTFLLFQDHPLITALICIVKGTAAGLCAGLVYRAVCGIQKKGASLAATFLAAATAPVVNTGLFILGALLVSDTLSANFVNAEAGETVIYFLVVVCAGINFLLELALNLIAAPAIFRLYQAFAKRLSRK